MIDVGQGVIPVACGKHKPRAADLTIIPGAGMGTRGWADGAAIGAVRLYRVRAPTELPSRRLRLMPITGTIWFSTLTDTVTFIVS